MEEEVKEAKLTPAGRLVICGLGFVVVLLLTASSFGLDLGLPTCAAATLIALVVAIKEKANLLHFAKEISWSTLLLVAGLFVMVEAVQSLSVLSYAQVALEWCRALTPAVGATAVGMSVGIANNLVNNLPLGLLAGATIHAANVTGLLTNAVTIGVDLGPNLSVMGSLATILWLLALHKERLDVSAWDFLKAGLLAMPVAMLAAIGGLLLMHRLFGV